MYSKHCLHFIIGLKSCYFLDLHNMHVSYLFYDFSVDKVHDVVSQQLILRKENLERRLEKHLIIDAARDLPVSIKYMNY